MSDKVPTEGKILCTKEQKTFKTPVIWSTKCRIQWTDFTFLCMVKCKHHGERKKLNCSHDWTKLLDDFGTTVNCSTDFVVRDTMTFLDFINSDKCDWGGS